MAWDEVYQTLHIGAPTYLEQQKRTDPSSILSEAQQVGAVYSYKINKNFFNSDHKVDIPLVRTGEQGVTIAPGASGLPESRQWGSRFGSSLAVSNGKLAVGAPGYTAALLYAGSDEAQKIFTDGKLKTNNSNDGFLIIALLMAILCFCPPES